MHNGATRVALSGRFGTGPLAAEGRVDAELGDLSALFRLAGRARPALPAELAGDVRFAGDVTLTAENSLHLRSGVLKLGANTLGLAADLTPGPERPKLTAKATTTTLTLPAMAGGGGAGGGGKHGWSRDPIDVSGLFALDADLALSADRIGLGTLVAGPAQLTL